MCDHARLSRAGTGEHQKRSSAVVDTLLLSRIERHRGLSTTPLADQSGDRFCYPLRAWPMPKASLPPELLNELKRWAAAEVRSVNGHVEYLLRDAVRRHRGRSDRSGDSSDASSSEPDAPTRKW